MCVNIPDQISGAWNDAGNNWVNVVCLIDCNGDLDNDGFVNVNDLLMIIDQWGSSNSPADINEDGIVDIADLLMVVGDWGPCE